MKALEPCFGVIEAKLTEFAAGEAPPLHASRWGRWFFWAMVLGILWCSAAPMLLPASFALNVIIAVGVVIETVGIIGFGILQIREILPALRNHRGNFAHRLDREFVMFREIVSWLRCHDVAELVAHLSFVRARRDMLGRRLGLFAGSMERLGVLPLLVALYLQIPHVTTWPPEITRVEVLAIWVLTLAYGVGWWAAGVTLRLDLYEQLLSAAVDEGRRIQVA